MSGGYENLRVYQSSLSFLGYRDRVLDSITGVVAACDHLNRASESIPLNIAHGSATRAKRERINYYGHAVASALECAACIDILAARKLVTRKMKQSGKEMLREIVSTLIVMQNEAASRLHEASARYGTADENIFFDHENLRAYTSALELIKWITDEAPKPACSSDLLSKLDRASTSVILNIAEGNGRLSDADKVKFFKTAAKANKQITALLDIAYHRTQGREKGLDLVNTTGKCLTGLIKSKEK